MSNKKLFIVDATAFCYRAFYAIKGLVNSSGQQTNAVYGFVRMINKLIAENKPEYLAVCFDVGKKTFRHEKYQDYKKQRLIMPDALISQLPIIKQVLFALKIPIFEKEGFEADDLIATITKTAKASDFEIVIITSDKDLMQLVDEKVIIINPYSEKDPRIDLEKVKEKLGVTANQVVDLLSLLGDKADNIPSIKGISEKKAVDLINKFGNLDEVLKNIDNIEAQGLREAVSNSKDQIILNKELVSLDDNISVDIKFDKMRLVEPDYQHLFELYKFLEFKAFLKDLPVSDTQQEPDVEVEKISDEKLSSIISGVKNIFFHLDKDLQLFLGINKKVFVVSQLGENAKKLLEDNSILKIGHDLKQAILVLNNSGIILRGLHFDSMIAAYLLNSANSVLKLTDIIWAYLKNTITEENLDGQKAIYFLEMLYPMLENEMKSKALNNLFYKVEMPLVEVLADMQIAGIKLDIEKLKILSKDIEIRLAQLIQEVYDTCGCEFNLNSPKQLREILFVKLALPVVKKTKTGPSTDEEVLTTLAQKHKLPQLLLEYRQLAKLKSTYIDALPEMVNAQTNRIHASFNQTGTETGRLSSSNPNLQNLPIRSELGKSIREAVIAFDANSELLSCDYSQIELRILAHLSGDEVLVEAFKSGEDIHKKTASLIYDVLETQVTEQMRNVAKRVNFGIVYGLSSYGLSKDLKIPVAQAQNFIDAYFLRYPKVKNYIQEQIDLAKKEGFVTTILGRRRYLPEINDKNTNVAQFAQRQAMNTPIQGSASDLIKLAMVNIHDEIKKKNYCSKLIMQIHDELVFNVPSGEKQEFSAMVKEKMEKVLDLVIPVKVDMKFGKNWG